MISGPTGFLRLHVSIYGSFWCLVGVSGILPAEYEFSYIGQFLLLSGLPLFVVDSGVPPVLFGSMGSHPISRLWIGPSGGS